MGADETSECSSSSGPLNPAAAEKTTMSRHQNGSADGLQSQSEGVKDINGELITKKTEEMTGRLASFPQLNPNPVIEVDSSGRVTFHNPAAEGVLEDLCMERKDMGVFLPQDLDSILKELEDKQEKTYYREISLKDRYFGENIHLVPQFDVVRIYAHDITGRVRAEEALRRAYGDMELRVRDRTRELTETNVAVKKERQRFYDVLEMLPVYVILLDPDHRVPFANRFFRERFGESCGRRCYEYLFERTEPCEVCETFTVMKTNAPHHWEWTGPDGRNYDIHDFPFTDTDCSPFVLEVGIDITERKQAEEALRRINETLEQRVTERTEELRAGNEELARFNRAAVGRELRMIELKKEINELCDRVGLPQRYRLDFDEEPPIPDLPIGLGGER